MKSMLDPINMFDDEYLKIKNEVFYVKNKIIQFDKELTDDLKSGKVTEKQAYTLSLIRGAANNLNELILSLMTLTSPFLLANLIHRFAEASIKRFNEAKTDTSKLPLQRLFKEINKSFEYYHNLIFKALDMFWRKDVDQTMIENLGFDDIENSWINETINKINITLALIKQNINEYKNNIPTPTRYNFQDHNVLTLLDSVFPKNPNDDDDEKSSDNYKRINNEDEQDFNE
jgi:hypothetical protein